MLNNLKIENVAVIEKADIEFENGLNILTGETGAGKSILIDSINAILGNRTSKDLIRTGASKACIRATFTDIPADVKELLQTSGYDVEEELLLYREITKEGKNICRINGALVTASLVRQVCSGLVTIHGQHDSQSLTNPVRHLAILDEYAQDKELRDNYHALYLELIHVKRKADELRKSENERVSRIDYLRYVVDEIESAQLVENEDEELRARKKIIDKSKNITGSLHSIHRLLSGSDAECGAVELIGRSMGEMQGLTELDKRFGALSEKLTALYYNAVDISSEAEDLADECTFDPAELGAINDRLEVLYQIKHKYGGSINSALKMLEDARAELSQMENAGSLLAEYDQKKLDLYRKAKVLAERLSQVRLAAFEELNAKLISELSFLNMPGIRFSLSYIKGPLASNGQDTVEFLISANPGEDPKPLAKIASGGELSRIMLALKSALSQRDNIGTVIYDEIDTGVSGSAAGKIGIKLKETSIDRQVLCITHTAQIAAKADHHLLILKNVGKDKTFTEITRLDHDGRVQALAHMISGDYVTDLSLANANEMLNSNAI